jgi:hypothetical protein
MPLTLITGVRCLSIPSINSWRGSSASAACQSRSCLKHFCSICRIRSLVRPNSSATSLRVRGGDRHPIRSNNTWRWRSLPITGFSKEARNLSGEPVSGSIRDEPLTERLRNESINDRAPLRVPYPRPWCWINCRPGVSNKSPTHVMPLSAIARFIRAGSARRSSEASGWYESWRSADVIPRRGRPEKRGNFCHESGVAGCITNSSMSSS